MNVISDFSFCAYADLMHKHISHRSTVMTRTKKLLWIAVAVVALLDCAFYVSRAARAPYKVAASTAQVTSLKPPVKGPINVAFLISGGANVMDIAGAWEVFGDAMLTSKGKPWHESDGDDMVMPFNTYIDTSVGAVRLKNGWRGGRMTQMVVRHTSMSINNLPFGQSPSRARLFQAEID